MSNGMSVFGSLVFVGVVLLHGIRLDESQNQLLVLSLGKKGGMTTCVLIF
jgi:hypothetical protein